MEVLKVGGVLLPFLAPAVYQARAPTNSTKVALRQYRASPRRSCMKRSFCTSNIRRQPDESQENDARLSSSPRRGEARLDRGPTDAIASLLDDSFNSMMGTATTPASRTSRSASSSPRAQGSTPPSRSASSDPERPRSSADDLRDAMGPTTIDDILRSMRRTSTGTSRTTPSARQASGSSSSESSSMNIEDYLNPRGKSAKTAPPPPPEPVRPLPIKLGPSVGRTVSIAPDRGMDVGRAFRTLEIQCARNSVRRDFMRQRFHERQGLRRKRLKSDRWRRRFKEGFQAIVKRVQTMKKQGW